MKKWDTSIEMLACYFLVCVEIFPVYYHVLLLVFKQVLHGVCSSFSLEMAAISDSDGFGSNVALYFPSSTCCLSLSCCCLAAISVEYRFEILLVRLHGQTELATFV